MANQEQVDLINQNIGQWNQWRRIYQGIRPELSGANLRKANLREADLSDADLSHADLSEAHLNAADLSSANLSHADLRSADLRTAHLNDAQLSNALLNSADLRGANLRRADLSHADLSDVNLIRADLARANWTGVTIGWTICGDVDLRSVIGLETVKHRGPSTIGLDTIYGSHGHIPEAFLYGAGVPETFLTNMHALVESMSPIEYYTCFIAYSHHDEIFVRRLYADLRCKGVRCWFAPEDLKIGDHYHQRIDESIRVYDKLVLILSEQAVQSAWVEREVVAAREKEDREGRPVLFPLRLDDAVTDTTKAWAADIRRRWHIGNFTQWKHHDAYQQAFERLLRDLKEGEQP
jgi:uncharacterized protein YjbI with pentapeptide repeats